MTTTSSNLQPTWKTHPEATRWVERRLEQFAQWSSFLSSLQSRLYELTGTRLLDWVDRMSTTASLSELKSLDYAPVAVGGDTESGTLYRHSEAKLPDLLWTNTDLACSLIAIRVERLTDFLQAHQLDERCTVVGNCGGSMIRALVDSTADYQVWVVERHGGWHWESQADAPLELVEKVRHNFRLRRRDWESDDAGFDHARAMVLDAVKSIGRDRACDEFFAAERAYWQFRNNAGQHQYARQQRLGLGWANHDHHTYRSSRHCFHRLVEIFELLGLQCRERFYAGKEAGWGAQVMEQPETGIVVFADVDLAVEEVVDDFAHQTLPRRDSLGTVGLWCALHGEAFLQAGMHHLECQFDFDAARDQLAQLGVGSMKPFTDLPHLRQSFTIGERWSVMPGRIERALRNGWITYDQAVSFAKEGAIGSHLEVLQRNDGYKGFNPKGISEIILDTDPRRQAM